MEIDVQPLPGASNVTCVAIDGRIDAYTVDRVEEELNSLIRIGSFNLICDLSKVEFVSSSGFKAFRRIIGFAREQEGDLKFCGLSEEVARLFNSVGFGNETGVFTTPEEAWSDFTTRKRGSGRIQPKDSPVDSGSGLKSKISGLLNSVGLSRENGDSSSPSDTAATSPKLDSAHRPTQIFSKDSSLKKTVIFSSSEKGASDPRENDGEKPDRFAKFEPVKFSVYPEPTHFQNLSQLLGTIGSLVGFSSTELVKLNVAVLEFCRSMVNELETDETFTIEIDSQEPGFRVSIHIPREDFDIYENLHPKTADNTLSAEEGKEWLHNYVDTIDVVSSAKGTRYLLSLDD